jgi:hypothetical protein
MLASLLPGLRELRAPLAAGYLWLTSGWLLFHDRVDTDSKAINGLLDLRDSTSTAAYVAAISFLAFILGALWEAAVAGAVGAVRAGQQRWPLAMAYRWWMERQRLRGSHSDRLSGLAETVALRLYRSVDEVIADVYGPAEGVVQASRLHESKQSLPDFGDEFDFGIKYLGVEDLGSANDHWWAAAESDLGNSFYIDFLYDYFDNRWKPIGPVRGRPLVVAATALPKWPWVMTHDDITRRVVRSTSGTPSPSHWPSPQLSLVSVFN